MTDSQFLPAPPDTHKIVPFLRFSTPPLGLKAYLLDKGVPADEVGTARAVLKELFEYVDRNETTRVHDVDPYTGITLHMSVRRIADEMDKSMSYVQSGLKTLRDNKIIEHNTQDKLSGCWSYKLKCYDPAIQYLEAHPELPKCTVKELVPTQEQQEELTETAKTDPDNIPLQNEDEVSPDSGNTHPISGDSNSIKNKEAPVLPDTGTSTSMDTNEVSEKRGDSLIDENQEGIDFVATKQIGELNEVLEMLDQSKRMNTSQTDEGVESYIFAFNQAFGIESMNIPARNEIDSASKLKAHLEGKLSAAVGSMPPLLFFKKFCVPRTKELMENGEMIEPPKYPHFYVEHGTGKGIVEYSIDKMRSESGAEKDFTRTKGRIERMQEYGTRPEDLSDETRKKIDELLGRETSND